MTDEVNHPTIYRYSHPERGIVAIVAKGNLLRFTVEQEIFEPSSNGLDGYWYWSEVYQSGIYDDPLNLIKDMKAAYPWIGSSVEKWFLEYSAGLGSGSV